MKFDATDEEIQRIVAELEQDDFSAYRVRQRVCLQIAAIGERAEPWLLGLLAGKSKVARARAGAALVLGEIQTTTATNALMTALGDRNPEVRKHAAMGLSKHRRPEVADAIVACLRSDPKPAVRQWAVFAAMALGNAIGEQVMLDAARDSSVCVAWEATWALAYVSHPAAPRLTLDLALRATSRQWNECGFYHEAVEIIARGGQELVPRLMELCGHQKSLVRSAAAAALGRIGDTRAVPSILPLLKRRSDKWATIRALGRLGTPEAVDAILKYADHPDYAEDVLGALHSISDPRTFTVCERYLKGTNRFLAVHAADTLSSLGDAGLAVLMAALAFPDADVRVTAAGWLCRQNPVVVELLIAALRDEDARVRSEAAQTLERIADPRTADALMQALDDPDRNVSGHAAIALAKIGDRRAIERIGAMIGGPDFFPRAAVRALWQWADPSSIPALMAACHSDDGMVQEGAARALGWIGATEAIELLIEMARSAAEPAVRRGAVLALGALGTEQATYAAWRALLDDTDINVAQAASDALRRLGDRELCSPDKWRRQELLDLAK